MATSQKVEKFDSEGLEGFKKSLFCTHCKMPPRPNGYVYTCSNAIKCDIVLCNVCVILEGRCQHDKIPSRDPVLKKFISLIKLFNCYYFSDGCQMELEAKDLDAHEANCIFREVMCPKFNCNAELVFDKLLDHYKEHSDSEIEFKDGFLEFKGTFEDLGKSVFILNCHGKPFFPQFRFDKRFLYLWVVGHGNSAEMELFEVSFKVN